MRFGERTRSGTRANTWVQRPSSGATYGIATLSGTGATSSTITADGFSWTLLTAINDGTLSVTKAGLFDVLLVGGGGAGGYSVSNYGTSGGGGGGGITRQTIYLAVGDYTVTIGAGGAGSASDMSTGAGRHTTIRSSTNTYQISGDGGGFGASPFPYGNVEQSRGGSGGGAKNNGTGGAAVVTGSGNNGGSGGSSGTYQGGGGGGGGGSAVGSNGSGNVGGAGGAGLDISAWLGQSASTTIKGGGGGGGGIGGNGAAGTGNGANNTGGGGRGSWSAVGLAGYSGIAYVRFR